MATNNELIYSRVKQEAFDGAVSNYRMEQKGLVAGEADKLAERELANLWMRSHHAIRNNGYAKSAKTNFVQSIAGITVKWQDEKGKVNKAMQAEWDKFIANPNLDGYGNFVNTQEGWLASLFESGEAFCRMLIKKRSDSSIPLVLQNIEAEYLDPTYSAGTPDKTRNGITFVDSKPSVYHFSKKLSGNLFVSTNSLEKVNVPADEILHLFIRERANQWRGIPMLASVLLPLYELDDLTDATIAKQKAAQAIAWIVKNTNPTSAVAIGSATLSLDENDTTESGSRRVITQASGGGTQYLNKGEDIAFYQGTDIGPNLPELIKAELHKIAQALGLTYVALTGDYDSLSFSALQQAAIEMRVRSEYISRLYVINLGLAPLCAKFQELASLYVSSRFSKLKPVYQMPRKYGVNDLKDAQADVLELQNNLTTMSRVLSERDLTIEEIEEDIATQKRLGIWKDPNKPVAANMAQTKNTSANSNSRGQ
jgi:lambda family phage portal protein